MHTCCCFPPWLSKFTTRSIQDSWLGFCWPADTLLLFLYSPGTLNNLEFQNLRIWSNVQTVGPQSWTLSRQIELQRETVLSLETEVSEPPARSQARSGKFTPLYMEMRNNGPRSQLCHLPVLYLGKVTKSFRAAVLSPASGDHTDIIGSWEGLNEIRRVTVSLWGGGNREYNRSACLAGHPEGVHYWLSVQISQHHIHQSRNSRHSINGISLPFPLSSVILANFGKGTILFTRLIDGIAFTCNK